MSVGCMVALWVSVGCMVALWVSVGCMVALWVSVGCMVTLWVSKVLFFKGRGRGGRGVKICSQNVWNENEGHTPCKCSITLS